MNETLQQVDFRVALPHAAVHDPAARTPVRDTLTFLHGELLLPDAPRGIVVFVAASAGNDFAHAGNAADCFHRHGLGTLVVDLLAADAARFSDAAQHLPMLAERLLAVVSQLTRLIDSEVVPALPIGLYAEGDATPLAVRVAAIRDRNVAALCCHGGLIDLAGLQYLRELKAPLQMLLGADDEAAAANLRRARPYIRAPITVQPLPTRMAEQAAELTANLAANWLDVQFRSPRSN